MTRDRTPDVIGTHPFRVEVYFGDDRLRAYVADDRGAAGGPGVQVLTPAAESCLNRTFLVTVPDLHQVASALGTEFPHLLNLACMFGPAQFPRRVSGPAGQAALMPRDSQLLDALKHSVDQAQALPPQAIVKAAMAYLASPVEPGGSPYGTLLGHLNHGLVNRGGNPRAERAWPPLASIQDIAPEGVQLWWVKEGSATIVFQVRVALTGGRPAMRFVVNVAKDLTLAAEELRQTWSDFRELYRMEPRLVMEPLGSGDVPVETPRGPGSAAVMAAEWFDGHELHVYEGSSQLYVWMDQRMVRSHPVPAHESDRIWEQVTRMRARYTRMTPNGLLPIATHVNAGDYIFRQNAGGEWDVLLIWARRPPPTVRPEDYVVLAGMLGGVNVFGSDEGKTVWWDQPERALRALRAGLAEAGLSEAQIQELLRQAHDGPFTTFEGHPEQMPYSSLVSTADHAELRQVFRRAKDALAACLGRAPAGTAPG